MGHIDKRAALSCSGIVVGDADAEIGLADTGRAAQIDAARCPFQQMRQHVQDDLPILFAFLLQRQRGQIDRQIPAVKVHHTVMLRMRRAHALIFMICTRPKSIRQQAVIRQIEIMPLRLKTTETQSLTVCTDIQRLQPLLKHTAV